MKGLNIDSMTLSQLEELKNEFAKNKFDSSEHEAYNLGSMQNSVTGFPLADITQEQRLLLPMFLLAIENERLVRLYTEVQSENDELVPRIESLIASVRELPIRSPTNQEAPKPFSFNEQEAEEEGDKANVVRFLQAVEISRLNAMLDDQEDKKEAMVAELVSKIEAVEGESRELKEAAQEQERVKGELQDMVYELNLKNEGLEQATAENEGTLLRLNEALERAIAENEALKKQGLKECELLADQNKVLRSQLAQLDHEKSMKKDLPHDTDGQQTMLLKREMEVLSKELSILRRSEEGNRTAMEEAKLEAEKIKLTLDETLLEIEAKNDRIGLLEAQVEELTRSSREGQPSIEKVGHVSTTNDTQNDVPEIGVDPSLVSDLIKGMREDLEGRKTRMNDVKDGKAQYKVKEAEYLQDIEKARLKEKELSHNLGQLRLKDKMNSQQIEEMKSKVSELMGSIEQGKEEEKKLREGEQDMKQKLESIQESYEKLSQQMEQEKLKEQRLVDEVRSSKASEQRTKDELTLVREEQRLHSESLGDLNDRESRLAALLKEAEATRDEYKRLMELAQQRELEMKIAVDKNSERIEELTEKMTDLTKAESEMSKSLEKEAKLQIELKGLLETAKRSEVELNQSLLNSKQREMALIQSLERAKERDTEYSHSIEKCKEKEMLQNQRIEKFEGEQRDLEKTVEELRSKVLVLTGQLEGKFQEQSRMETSDKVASLENYIVELETTQKQSQDQIQDYSVQLKQHKASLESTRKLHDFKDSQTKRLEEKCSAVCDQLRLKEKEIVKLQAAHQEAIMNLEATEADLKNRNSIQMHQIGELKQQMISLQNELKLLRTKLESTELRKGKEFGGSYVNEEERECVVTQKLRLQESKLLEEEPERSSVLRQSRVSNADMVDLLRESRLSIADHKADVDHLSKVY